MHRVIIELNLHSTRIIAKDFSNNNKIVYHTTKATHYQTAKNIILNEFIQYYSQYNVRFTIRDTVTNETYRYNLDKSVPPEDKYKGLPTYNKYIPDRLITLEANGMRYKIDKDFNIYTEDNSAYYRNVRKSKLRYLTSQYDNNRMSAETFVYELNKAIDNRWVAVKQYKHPPTHNSAIHLLLRKVKAMNKIKNEEEARFYIYVSGMIGFLLGVCITIIIISFEHKLI